LEFGDGGAGAAGAGRVPAMGRYDDPHRNESKVNRRYSDQDTSSYKSSDNASYEESLTHEERMAQMKARKDRHREVINQEYEKKLQEAYQLNKEAQKKLKHKIMQSVTDDGENLLDDVDLPPNPSSQLRRNDSVSSVAVADREEVCDMGNNYKKPTGAVAFEISFKENPSARRPPPKVIRSSASSNRSSDEKISQQDSNKTHLASETNEMKSSFSPVNITPVRIRKSWGPRATPDDIRPKVNGSKNSTSPHKADSKDHEYEDYDDEAASKLSKDIKNEVTSFKQPAPLDRKLSDEDYAEEVFEDPGLVLGLGSGVVPKEETIIPEDFEQLPSHEDIRAGNVIMQKVNDQKLRKEESKQNAKQVYKLLSHYY